MIFLLGSIFLSITLIIIIKDNYNYYKIKQINKRNIEKYKQIKKNNEYLKENNNTLIKSLNKLVIDSNNINKKLNYNK